MVPQRLPTTITWQDLQRIGSYFLPIIKFVISSSSFCIIDIRPIFVRLLFRSFFINKIFIGHISHRITSHCWEFRCLVGCIHLMIHNRVANGGLVVGLPVLCSCFKHTYWFSEFRLSRPLAFLHIVRFSQRICLEIKRTVCSFNHVLGVVIFGFSHINVALLVHGVVVVEVVKRVDLIRLFFSWGPNLTGLLQLLTLFFGWVRILLVRSEPSVSHNFVDHFWKLYYEISLPKISCRLGWISFPQRNSNFCPRPAIILALAIWSFWPTNTLKIVCEWQYCA